LYYSDIDFDIYSSSISISSLFMLYYSDIDFDIYSSSISISSSTSASA